ncbi:MAG: pantoate--beta-alanine ligase [Anaerohalosphaeraceae bacterium]|nr:pantoate--beta-alanine ligase [Anaerohalosphaeraceae bacterium]
MEITETIQDTRELIAFARTAGETVGFVPTMGALHEGHFSLIRAAKKACDFVVVSIFVNPAQFGPTEDIGKYPRTLESDCDGCRSLGVDLVFAPAVSQMYPSENITWVTVNALGGLLCGKSRPDHFRGVTTVCAKLLNIVSPDFAFFGQKDAQQSIIIKRMVADLNMPLEIVVCPTVRQSDGLAMSSRNKYLNPRQRTQATLIYAALQYAELLIASGQRKAGAIIAAMEKILKTGADIKIDYISIVDIETLRPIENLNGEILVAVAAGLGSARLIDNIIIDIKNA